MPSPLMSVLVNAAGANYRYNRYSRAMKEQMRDWLRLEDASQDNIYAQQTDKLQRIISLAYQTPYYKRVMDRENIDPGKKISISDLRRFPLLSRKDIEQNFDDMIVPGSTKKYLDRSSSGTTGRPVTYRQPKELVYHQVYAMLYQFYSWHGYAPLEKRATLGGRYLGRRQRGTCYMNHFEKQLLLGIHSLGPNNINKYVDSLSLFAPKLLQGHPSAINYLVDLANRRNISLPKVPMVSVTGENLSDDQRDNIQDAFNANVFATYGMGEACIAGSECAEQNGYHLHPIIGITELIDTGHIGNEVVATSLLNDVMPIIRYRTGDLATRITYEACGCGRTWPRLQGVLGRVDDIITASNGEPIVPVSLRTDISNRFKRLPPYTLIQRADRRNYTLRFFADDRLAVCDFLRDYLEKRLGPDCQVEIEFKPASEFLTNKAKHKIVIKEHGDK